MAPDFKQSTRRKFENKEEFVVWLKNRTKAFAIRAIRFCNTLPKNQATHVIAYQFIKSATSLAANYRAACRGRSGAEFYSKLCIVVEEADESVFWLEVIKESGLNVNQTELDFLHSESKEITAVMTTAKKNARVNYVSM